MNYLGVDYGKSMVGLALAVTPLAEPLPAVPAERALSLIKDLVRQYVINEIVIGLPDGEMKAEVEQFALQLEETNCVIHLMDETLSSHDARESLFHTTQKKRKELEHSVAAALILQHWLDSRKLA